MLIIVLLTPILKRYSAFWIISAIILIIIIFLRYGSIFIASYYFQMKNFKRGFLFTKLTILPQFLSKSVKGYYYLYKGMIERNEDRLEKAEVYFNKALKSKMRTSNDSALVYAYLSEVLQLKGSQSEAKKYIQLAKDTPHKDILDDYLQKLEDKIKYNG